MSDGYTPTTEAVRAKYARGTRSDGTPAQFVKWQKEFDRWLREERAAQARFWTKVDRKDDESCWLWTATKNPNGYGMWKLSGRSRGAHLFAYEWLVGPIPNGMEIDHKCRVRNCVNPRHLEAVTHRENTLRGDTITANAAAKRYCPRGHALIEGNLVASTAKRGARQCLTCSREMAREYRARKKATEK